MTGPRLAKVSTTVSMIATVALLLAIVAAIAAWVITRRPAVRPLEVPSVAQT
jgi:hypothetical protein